MRTAFFAVIALFAAFVALLVYKLSVPSYDVASWPPMPMGLVMIVVGLAAFILLDRSKLLRCIGPLFVVGIGLLLAGCCVPREVVRVQPVEVLVPVPVMPPAPPVLDRPRLDVAVLDSTSTQDEIVRAYVLTAYELQAYSLWLERIIESYRPFADSSTVAATHSVLRR
ncbi:MAG: hypothetical protein AAFV01_04205 [Bacteroidota bacterium]